MNNDLENDKKLIEDLCKKINVLSNELETLKLKYLIDDIRVNGIYQNIDELYNSIKILNDIHDNNHYQFLSIGGIGTTFFIDEEDYSIELIKNDYLKERDLICIKYTFWNKENCVSNITGFYFIDYVRGVYLDDETLEWISVYGEPEVDYLDLKELQIINQLKYQQNIILAYQQGKIIQTKHKSKNETYWESIPFNEEYLFRFDIMDYKIDDSYSSMSEKYDIKFARPATKINY